MNKQKLYDEIERDQRKKIANAKKRYHLAKFILDNLDLPDDFPAKLGYAWAAVLVRCAEYDPEKGCFKYRGYPKLPVIDLKLKDTWKYEEEDREVLAEIMRHFKCVFHDQTPEWKERDWETKYLPKAVYRGIGRLGKCRVIINLEAPWPVRGCELKTVMKPAVELVCK